MITTFQKNRQCFLFVHNKEQTGQNKNNTKYQKSHNCFSFVMNYCSNLDKNMGNAWWRYHYSSYFIKGGWHERSSKSAWTRPYWIIKPALGNTISNHKEENSTRTTHTFQNTKVALLLCNQINLIMYTINGWSFGAREHKCIHCLNSDILLKACINVFSAKTSCDQSTWFKTRIKNVIRIL